jgi:putative oxidoreductase
LESRKLGGIMANADSAFSRWAPVFLSILRIATALIFIEHGTQKLFGFPPSDHPPGGPLPMLLVVAAWIEFGGGLLLLFGLLTRVVAFITAGEMAAAYFMQHAQRSFYPIQNHGELAVVLCFVFIYFVFAGAGPWSIDALMKRRDSSVAAT